MDDASVIRELTRRWNADDLDGALELFADDAVTLTTRDWPDEGPWHGREAHRAAFASWRAPWETMVLGVDAIEEAGDGRLVVQGHWISRGRASGAGAELHFCALFTIRDGLIARSEYFRSLGDARQAAGLA
jgi:ketosteroid isomerase-like protein